MKQISLVAFDCDGVLFDTANSNRSYYNTILHHLGMPDMTPEQFDFIYMHTVHESLVFLFEKAGKLKQALAFRENMSYDAFIKQMEMEPHLIPLLTKMRTKFKTAIATNRTDSMKMVLDVHQLNEYFDLVVCASDVPRAKPYPDPLLKILEHFHLEPEQVLYVGDSKLDEDAAREARIPFIAFGNPALAADYHIQELKALEEILQL